MCSDLCLFCKKENLNGRLFCSRECSNKSRTKTTVRICKTCLINFNVSRLNRYAVYCSNDCKKEAAKKRTELRKQTFIYNKRNYKFTETEFKNLCHPKINQNNYYKLTCTYCSNNYYIYKALKEKYKHYCSMSCKRANSLKNAVSFLPKKEMYSNVKHLCSYEQYKYMSRLLAKARARVKKSKKPCLVTLFELIELLYAQSFLCALTKVPLTFIGGNTNKNTASIDRIDSSLGYTKGNIQIVTKVINTSKWDLSNSDFIRLCGLVTKENTL